MTWGESFKKLRSAASAKARAAADKTLSSAAEAYAAVERGADRAAKAAAAAGTAVAKATVQAARATAKAVSSAAQATAQAAVAGGKRVAAGAVAVGKGAANVGSFVGRAAGGTLLAVPKGAAALARKSAEMARNAMSPTTPPKAVTPCPDSWPAKKERLQKRQGLIGAGRKSRDPSVRKAAERMARNNEAVELAKLSEDSYARYPGEPFKYPDSTRPRPAGARDALAGWDVVPASELQANGVDVKDMEAARAVLYRTPSDWPGGQKTVLAFRGTADLDDGVVDVDQAMGVSTTQYKSANVVGHQVAKGYGSSVEVTGHSLGGGKAQAAGVSGGLKGTMFNAAGLHPDSAGAIEPDASAFTQYRTSGDPLTGLQNSASAQVAAAGVGGPLGTVGGGIAKVYDVAAKGLGFGGLSAAQADYADKAVKALPRAMRNVWEHGNVTPPALGQIREVPAIDDAGQTVSGANLMGQHSIVSAVNGIEQQKTEDLHTLGG